MTLAAVKKLAIQLPLKQRVQLANTLLESIPPMREPSSLVELEARADEVLSGRVKAISEEAFDRELEKQLKSVRQRRRAHRG